MYNKKKIATLLVIGMAAMFMMNGCQKKASETETTKQTTAQSESTAQTEAATTYTSESNSFSFDLPDSAWVATKEGIENKWAFMKEGVGTIRITHKKVKDQGEESAEVSGRCDCSFKRYPGECIFSGRI